MYQQIFDPVLGQLGLSALVAAIPLLMFVLLGVFRWRAHWAGLAALVAAELGRDRVRLARIVHSRLDGQTGRHALLVQLPADRRTLLFVSGVLTTLMLKVSAGRAARINAVTVKQLTWTIVCVLCVLALAYVMNLSGQTGSLGRGLAALGAVFAFFSPVIGWIGVAITEPDNSSNALFGAVQVTAAQQTGLSPQMISPQSVLNSL
ncbi:L-lactate permease [Nonomuraea sp. CA-143628]|uniref:L-lactate permease n=1 Tax=Nonomuraea sp. CA-143628 TaxID=3239997 RepID=UPI003D91D594